MRSLDDDDDDDDEDDDEDVGPESVLQSMLQNRQKVKAAACNLGVVSLWNSFTSIVGSHPGEQV